MVKLPKQLPDDPELLKKLIVLLASERNDFFERLKILEQRYKGEMRNKYGRRSESLDPDQLRLFIQAAMESETGEATESELSPIEQSADEGDKLTDQNCNECKKRDCDSTKKVSLPTKNGHLSPF